MKYLGSEDDLQKTVASYLNVIGCLWTHVANERKTSVKRSRGGKWYSPEGSKLKAMGVKRGVPDVMIFEPRGKYLGLAIELKVGYNKPSEDQEFWMNELREREWMVFWSNDLDEIVDKIDQYFEQPMKKGLFL